MRRGPPFLPLSLPPLCLCISVSVTISVFVSVSVSVSISVAVSVSAPVRVSTYVFALSNYSTSSPSERQAYHYTLPAQRGILRLLHPQDPPLPPLPLPLSAHPSTPHSLFLSAPPLCQQCPPLPPARLLLKHMGASIAPGWYERQHWERGREGWRWAVAAGGERHRTSWQGVSPWSAVRPPRREPPGKSNHLLHPSLDHTVLWEWGERVRKRERVSQREAECEKERAFRHAHLVFVSPASRQE